MNKTPERATYEIRRTPYGKSRWTYTVLRDGIELPLALYSRKKDAEARIREDVANVT
jgi:hypothetical protein